MVHENTIFGEDWAFSKAKSVLLQSAAEVMCEQGPRAATLKNIAGHAGVTEPAIFRHFDGVDGVFQSLFSVYELYFNLFQNYFKTTEYSGFDRLESALLQMLQVLKADSKYAYLLCQPDAIFRQYPKLKKRMEELRTREKAAIVDALKEAKAKSQLLATVDVEAAALMVKGGIAAILMAWNDDTSASDPMKEGKKFITAVRAMLGKGAAASKVVVKPLEKPAPVAKDQAPKAAVPKKAAPAAKQAKPTAAPKKPETKQVTAAKKKDAKPAAKPAATKAPAAKPVAKPAAKPVAKKPADKAESKPAQPVKAGTPVKSSAPAPKPAKKPTKS